MEFHSDGIPFSLQQRKAVKSWLLSCIIKENKTAGEIVFVFTSDRKLKHINRKFLNHDYHTDIITFPYHHRDDKNISGDIYISIETVRKNAKFYMVSTTDELHRVMVHGILHLCGYSDSTPAEKKKMSRLEDLYLSKRDFTAG